MGEPGTWADVTDRVQSLVRGDCYVYRAWDAAGACLYVGLTSSLEGRLKAHASNGRRGQAAWFAQAVRFDAQRFDSREDAARVERAEISRLRPPGNTRFASEEPPEIPRRRRSLTPEMVAALEQQLQYERRLRTMKPAILTQLQE